MHNNAFSRLKDNILKAPVLKYYPTRGTDTTV